MMEGAKEIGFLLKAGSCFSNFISGEVTLAHLFNGDVMISVPCIDGLINGTHTTSTSLAYNEITLMQYRLRRQFAGFVIVDRHKIPHLLYSWIRSSKFKIKEHETSHLS